MRRLFCMAMLVAASVFVATASDEIPDSLLVNVRAMSHLVNDRPEYALKVVDEIERRGNDTALNCERIRLNCYAMSSQYIEMISSGERCLSLAERYAKQPDVAGIELCQTLASSCSHANFYDQAVHYAQKGIEYAERAGDYYISIGYLKLIMAQVRFNMGYYDNAISDAIEGYQISCKHSNESDERHRYSYQLSMLSFITNSMDRTGDYSAALPFAQKMIDAVEGLCRQKEMPKVLTDQFECYAKVNMSYLLLRLGNRQESDRWFAEAHSDRYRNSKSVRQSLIRYYTASRNFAQVKLLAEESCRIDRQMTDTLTKNYADNLSAISLAEYELGNLDNAYRWQQRAMLLEQHSKEHIIQSNALELSVIYNVKEKEKEIIRLSSERKLYIAIVAAILIICILLIIKWNDTRKRNRQMAKQIGQLQLFKKEHSGRLASLPLDPATIESPDMVGISAARLKKIYSDVIKTVEKDELYLSDLNLDDWCRQVGYNRNVVGQAMQLYRGMTLTKFITELRLVKSAELLSDPTLSVESVAEHSGFGSSVTLIRNFKQYYGMTPSEYRRVM